jgi:hypothetical protein
MVIEFIETNVCSETQRRNIAKELELTKLCYACGGPAYPHSIKPERMSNRLTVKWHNVEEHITCSRTCTRVLLNLKTSKEDYLKRGKKSSQTQKGRTYEEIHGSEKAKILKEKMSCNFSKDNPRWSLKYRTPLEIEEQKEKNRFSENSPFSKLNKGKTWDQLYGKEKSAEMKSILSKKNSGENNPMYGKTISLYSGSGIKGYYRGIFYRSLIECSFLHQCFIDGIEVIGAETAEFWVNYEYSGCKRTYRPDFYLPAYDTVVEIKHSRFLLDPVNIEKFKSANKIFNNFNILTEKDIPYINRTEFKKLIDTECIKVLQNKLTK